MLIQVKASAGSGKTHSLTDRFLTLVLGAGDELPPACGARENNGYAVPEILAVTFTNKAAAEMKVRVITALKALALDRGRADPAARAKARHELGRLLIHAQRLNIRTIDSLLNLLARLFALELGLRPDFEPIFSTSDILGGLYDRLAADLPHDPGLTALFNEAAAHHTRVTPGFLPTDSFRARLFRVADFLLASGVRPEADPEALRLALERRQACLTNAASALHLALTGAGFAVLAHFQAFLERCRGLELGETPPDSAYAAKIELAGCLKKASAGSVTPRLEALYTALKQAYGDYRRDQAVLRGAMALAPFVPLAERLLAALTGYLADKGLFPAILWPRLVARMLDSDLGVPDAWCRLGARLVHLCIDEFQDTGVDQWQVLRLLAIECLAKGGSLFLVGDVKQAIYGWRGGDAGLFAAAPADPEITRLTTPETRVLPFNWRSAPAVIAANNRFFSPLGSPQTARRVAEALLGQAHQAAVKALTESLATAFVDAGQQCPADRPGPQGQHRVLALPGYDVAEYEAAAREELIRLLTEELLPRHGPGQVAVLTRSNAQAAKVAQWCIDAGLPVVTENSLRLADHPLVRQINAMLAFLDYPPDDLAFWSFVSGQELFGDISGIPRRTLTDWLASRPRQGSGGSGTGRGGLYRAFRETWPDPWARLIAPYLRQTGLAAPYDLAREIVAGYRLIERRPSDEAFIRRYLEIVHLAENKGHASLAAFLDFWNTLGEDEKVPQPESVDAVRVMTIHKAKGLQFPAVVVPFHHFAAGSPNRDLVTAVIEDTVALVPDQAGLGQAHALRRAEALAEQVHLLYVAWTRAETELHAFVPAGGKLRDDYPLPRAMDTIFAVLGLDPTEGPVVTGSPPDGDLAMSASCAAPARPRDIAAAPWPENASVPPPMAWLPRLKVYRNAVRDIRAALTFGERARGELAHRAVERLARTGFDPNDPGPAINRAVASALTGSRLPEELIGRLTENFTDMLTWLVGLPPCQAALAQGLPERTLLAVDGGHHRPDLLDLAGTATLVVDFKTGAPDKSHAGQVRRYLALARSLPGRDQIPVRGLLVYLDQRICRDVEDVVDVEAKS